MEKNKKIIAVSGGVDSMFLLNHFIINNKHDDLIVAHVNYNIREDVKVDQKIIEDFCQKYNLKLEILSINEKHIGNFQEWARNQRYNFFKKLYKEYQCSTLLIAQHKDDFLETAIMQWRSKKNPYFYGINKDNQLFDMNIYRPMIFKYWKEEIYDKANQLKIPFNDDYTNFTDYYYRNVIRKNLSYFPLTLKEVLFKSFQMINVQKSLLNIEIIKKYFEWSKTNFNIGFLENNREYSKSLIFRFLIKNFDEVNISSKILNSLELFLLTKNNEAKTFLLTSDQKIGKFNNNVVNISKI